MELCFSCCMTISCYCFEFCLCLCLCLEYCPTSSQHASDIIFDEIRGHFRGKYRGNFPFLSLKDFQWKLQTKFSIEVMLLDVLFWFKLHSNKCNDKIHIEKTLNFVKTIAYLGYGPKQLLYRDWTDNRAHHPKVKISLKRFFINSIHTPLNISVCRWQLLLRTAKSNRQHQQQFTCSIYSTMLWCPPYKSGLRTVFLLINFRWSNFIFSGNLSSFSISPNWENRNPSWVRLCIWILEPQTNTSHNILNQMQ